MKRHQNNNEKFRGKNNEISIENNCMRFMGCWNAWDACHT
jgi:hypothetical protein